MKNKGSGKFTFLAAAFAVFLLAACQNAQVIDYVKYETAADVPRISVKDAKKEFEAGKVIFVDSRSEAAYKSEHLPGAINIPYGSPEDKYGALPKGQKIIVYCT